ncbi:hypothetical protein SAMN05443665_105032 [Actinomadura meyerae]|uniref:Condensation domain-containing protein n=1 Tax=Actinomadura meyerae TaxID=240840 RepID=A0A239NUW2_9ACTN|nr:hypothetical protein [Actinomadura meyerae]SNT58656.1 hypothetical protein SAMN05443665_105032 [Actinomadura meyerae]
MAGPAGREGPLTWYQEAVWWSQYWNPPDESYPPMPDVWYLPERPTVDVVRAAFAELAARHEILRTSLPLGGDGLPRQRLHAAGAVPMPLRPVPLGEFRRDVAGTLGGFRRPGAADADRPRWRAVLGVKEGRVPAVGFAGDRLVMDGGAVVELRRQFQAALRGRGGAPAGGRAHLQPLARADHERSAAGRAKADAALAHLAGVFGSAPGPLFTGPPAPPGTPRYVEASTRSPELLAGAAQAARLHRVTLPTVVLAAFATVLALRTGRACVPVRSLCANRTTAAERTSVLGLYQPVHLLLDLSGDPVMADVVRRTWRESVRAYAHSEYPPDEFRETVVRAARGRGFVPEFQLDYDFLPGPAAARPPAGRGEDGAEPPVEHSGSDQGRPGYALFQARVLGEELTLALDADTALVPRAEIDRLLSWTVRALFRLADAAAGGTRRDEFGAAIGLDPAAPGEPHTPPAPAVAGAVDPAAERALREAFLTAHEGVDRVDLDDDYVAAGGRLRRVPRLVRSLAGRGFGGLRAEHVETPVSLRSVAAGLRRMPSGGAR